MSRFDFEPSEQYKKEAYEWRKKKIKEFLEADEKKQAEMINFILTIAEKYKYKKLIKYCEEKLKNLKKN